jgi:hypothetical protein
MCCGWCCTGELGGESVFLLLVGVGPSLGRVRVSFGSVFRLPARKTLDMGGWVGVWYACDALLWVTLGAVCVGGFGGMFWLGILMRFVRGDGEWRGLLCLFSMLGFEGYP